MLQHFLAVNLGAEAKRATVGSIEKQLEINELGWVSGSTVGKSRAKAGASFIRMYCQISVTETKLFASRCGSAALLQVKTGRQVSPR